MEPSKPRRDGCTFLVCIIHIFLRKYALILHTKDQRNVPSLGRIPDPDDILASIRVEDGQMLIDTYQPMPSYRLCTGDGILQLTDGLMSKLKDVLDRDCRQGAV